MAILRDHSNRDLRVFGDVTVPNAVVQGLAIIKQAKSRNNRGVVWFGESHSYCCDVERRMALFDQLYPDEGIILVSERCLESGSRLGSAMVETLLELRKGGVTEAADRTSYNIAERNRRIAVAIVSECNKDSGGQTRPVAIFFGDDHSEPIKKLLAESLPATDIVEWWDAPPISDTLLARANTTLPPDSTHKLICGAREKWGSEADVQLLQAACGVSVPHPVTFTALSPLYYIMDRFNDSQLTYALFGRINDPSMNAFQYFWNPAGPQAKTFQYLNHHVQSLAAYTLVYVKTADIFEKVKERAESES